MSFNCNNGVCYLNSGSSVGGKKNGDFPMPSKHIVWTIYGRTSCPFCVKVRQLLDKKMIKYVYYDVTLIACGNQTKEKLSSLTGGYDKVPIVFFNGNFMGGYSEVAKHFEENV